ncbi:MAG: alkene reductase [Hyphomicrobiales bacterium]|nr:alkene reductase [Hyphomicrobiales bacterium]
MPTLFDPIRLGDLDLPNRIVMAPMTRSRADAEGTPKDFVADYYAQRASAGLIVGEATYISPMAKGYVRTPGIVTDAHIAGWKKVTDAVHAKGGTILCQLYHTGRVALPEFLPGGAQPIGPSALQLEGNNQTDSGPKPFVMPRALETAEIPGVAQEFAHAAKRAMAAGFDGVEIHAASGYLIQQFLDSAINQRTDEYGGSVENRCRFLLEVVDTVTSTIGAGRTGIKLSPRIKFNGVTEPDAEAVYPYLAEQLSGRKLAYLHGAKQGGYEIHAEVRPLYKGHYLAGAGFTAETGNEALASGAADAIVFGKSFLANPDLPRRMRDGLALAEADPKTIYWGSEQGYSDYPAHP